MKKFLFVIFMIVVVLVCIGCGDEKNIQKFTVEQAIIKGRITCGKTSFMIENFNCERNGFKVIGLTFFNNHEVKSLETVVLTFRDPQKRQQTFGLYNDCLIKIPIRTCGSEIVIKSNSSYCSIKL